jgi:hypothetical protein
VKEVVGKKIGEAKLELDGALATYGIDSIDQYRRARAYIDRSCF